MTTTPTASPELPDLDHLEALARTATAGPWLHRRDPGNPIGAQHCVKLAGENGAWVCDCIDNADRSTVGGIAGERNAAFIAAANPEQVLALIALARRAQPEGDMGYPISVSKPKGEAPQADLEQLNGGMHDSIFVKVWGDAGGGDAGRRKLADYAYALGKRASISLSPLCGAQHAESGKETAQLSIGFANNDQGVHVSVMQQHAGGAVTLLHQAKVPFGNSFARFAIAAQQATAPGVLYSYIGESGRYELLGHAVGAGKCKLVEPLAIYRDTATGNLYFRAPADFAERMEPIEDNTPEFGEIKTSAPGTPEAPPYAIMGIDWSTDYLTEQRAAMRDAAAQLVENAREGSLRADTARAIRALDATPRAAQLDGGQGGE